MPILSASGMLGQENFSEFETSLRSLSQKTKNSPGVGTSILILLSKSVVHSYYVRGRGLSLLNSEFQTSLARETLLKLKVFPNLLEKMC